MQAIVPLITKAATFLSGAGGAAIQTGLAVAGTVTSVLAANAAADAQRENALAQAEQARKNAEQARLGGQADAQNADFEAAAILATLEARNAGSGFLLTSPGFQRRQDRNRVAADINRSRIIEDSEIQAQNSEADQASALSNAKAAQSSKRMNLLAGTLQVGTDLVSGAALYNKRKTSVVDRNRIGVA